MKKFTFGAFAFSALIAAASPAMAEHHGHYHGKKSASHMQKSDEASATDALNARSLQQAQTPVQAQAPAAPLPVATAPTSAVVPTAPVPTVPPAASTMPATAPTDGQ
ncbi:hypothetical protein ABDK75_06745 [Gluconobacter sp. OJA]|uniref:hypothetical protein n=1 Tax=Gluconobacter sp. OJA TaxID=3145197 RepID=UPI0031F9D357